MPARDLFSWLVMCYRHEHRCPSQTIRQLALLLSLLAGMLRILQMSGQELPAVSMEEISSVQDLKASLRSQHGLPMCMQKVLLQGNSLENATKLDAPVDLQLILLSTLSTEEEQVEAAEELAKACAQGDVQIVRLLLEAGADKNAEDPSGNTALMLAAENSHVEIGRLLLEAGADKEQAGDGYTALMLAAKNDHVEIARLLLEAGADKDVPTGHGCTALMLAARTGHVEIARLLLQAGADKDLQRRDGCTALMLAARNRDVKMTRLLLEAGADKGLERCDGCTALMLTAEKGYVEIAEMLLEAGADKNVQNGSVLRIAEKRGHDEVAMLLRAKARKISNAKCGSKDLNPPL